MKSDSVVISTRPTMPTIPAITFAFAFPSLLLPSPLLSLSIYISLHSPQSHTQAPLSEVGNMSWRSVRGSRKRKMDFELDLNRDPPLVREEEEEEEEGGPSRHQQHHHHQQEPQTPIVDVDAIDDDVVESSPRSFAQAKSNADERRRVRRRTTIVDLDSEDGTGGVPQNQTIINGDLYVNLANNSSSASENAKKTPEPPKEPEAPKEPVFNCPICMSPLVEEMSTRCGHIFCKNCIRAAISAQAKCPTCRKKVTKNSLIRVFLPATS